MKSKNCFFYKRYFLNYSFWQDHFGFFLIPTIIFDKNLPICPITKISRLSFYFLKYRFCLDIGSKKERTNYSWNNAEMDKYIQWWRKDIKRPINKDVVEDFIYENKYIKEILEYSTADFYYVKKIIFKNSINTINNKQKK